MHNSHSSRFHLRQRGVTVLEALIAMAIMAFGMLAVVGVQSTLRYNADIAKQRSEATRIAEQEVERIRSFTAVGSGGGGSDEFDNAAVVPQSITPDDGNTTYALTGSIEEIDDVHRVVLVRVTWPDRQGLDRTVVLRDVIARVDPVLSGIVTSRSVVTTLGRRDQNRHPTIPARAHPSGDQSFFKPNEGGDKAWVFDNATGVITHVCNVSTTITSDQVALTMCTPLTSGAQLLSGEIRFNLRGGTRDLLDGEGISVIKPVQDGDKAWVIKHATGRIIRLCPVSAASTTATLTAAEVSLGCLNTDVPISPFDPADASVSLDASDSENPVWPSLPVSVGLTMTSTGHSPAPTCYTTAHASSLAVASFTPPQTVVEYYCIIFANSSMSWSGRSELSPVAYSEASAGTWSIGTSSTTYKVCRYTQDVGDADGVPDDFTDNVDHPRDYSIWHSGCGPTAAVGKCRPVTGNLINQNFLVINGAKSCPTDVAANPASGDLVNSNTLQHQP